MISEKRIIPLVLGTSWRERPIAAGLQTAELARKFAGISRVSRIDGLTELKFPVFSVARPNAKSAVTVNSGKGVTEQESRASGLFEAIEVACAENPLPSVQYTQKELHDQGMDYMPLEMAGIRSTHRALGWCQAVDYETQLPVYVPEAMLSLLPAARSGESPSDSNGLASGSSFHEALFHALMEVIERHGYALALVHRLGLTLDLNEVNLKTHDLFVFECTSAIDSKGLKVEVKDLSEWTGIPTYYALIFSEADQDSHRVGGGLGSHLDPMIALRRAMTEALQSRAIAIAGIREDITETRRTQGSHFIEARRIFSFWYEPTQKKAVVPQAISPMPFTEAIAQTLNFVRKADTSLGRLIYYSYPSPEGIQVVRAILEGAENYGLNRSRVGPRIRQLFSSLGLTP